MIKIGIDPGKDTGFAIAVGGKIKELQTLTFWDAYLKVRELQADGTELEVFIEVPNTKKNWHVQEAAHDVGRVCREAELLADGIEALEVKVTRIHPQGKIKADYFKRVTGYQGRTNQHQRDAGMLVYGR